MNSAAALKNENKPLTPTGETTFPSSPRDAAVYLAAMIDGEGCVGVYYLKDTHRLVNIVSTDIELIEAVQRCLVLLGIKHNRRFSVRDELRKNGTKMKDIHSIDVCAFKGLKTINDLVPIQSIRKKAKLVEAIASYRPQTCWHCGVERDARTLGCGACISRHKHRRRMHQKGHYDKAAILCKRGRPRASDPKILFPLPGDTEFIAPPPALNPQRIKKIRGLYGTGRFTLKELGDLFEISRGTVRRAVDGMFIHNFRNSAFTEERENQVRKIRAMHGTGDFTVAKLSRAFGLHRGIINRIISRKTWTHI